MANVDKNQAVIDFLITCPSIRDNPLFFNFLEAKDDNKQLVVTGNEKSLNVKYIDGSEEKRFTFTIIDYKSIAYQAIVKPVQVGTSIVEYPNENVQEVLEVQSIIDWITEQEEAHNYPDFGDNCVIEEMRSLTENPNLNGVDTNVSPALAKYSISIQIDYIDTSKTMWNNT